MFRNILVPLDGSDLAAKILPQVEGLAKAMKAEVTLITVGMHETPLLSAEYVPTDYAEVLDRMQSSAEAYLEEQRQAMKTRGAKVGWVYRRGVPAREIMTYAVESGADLIAMATHGRGEIAWVLGSVAEKVASHATVPVLLLRVLEERPLPALKTEATGGGEKAAWGSE